MFLSMNPLDWVYNSDKVVCQMCCDMRYDVKGCPLSVYRCLDGLYWLSICWNLCFGIYAVFHGISKRKEYLQNVLHVSRYSQPPSVKKF